MQAMNLETRYRDHNIFLLRAKELADRIGRLHQRRLPMTQLNYTYILDGDMCVRTGKNLSTSVCTVHSME